MIVRAGEDLTRPEPRPAVRVAAVLLVAVLCLALAEGVSRLIRPPYRVAQAAYNGWAQTDPTLGWRTRAGVYRSHEGTHEAMTILADGSRTVGSTPAAGPSVFFVGCSFTQGYGVRDDETMAWKLQQRFPELRFKNYGTSGYGTYQSLLLLRELVDVKQERPAVVVYGFVPFHADRNVLTGTMVEAFRFFGGSLFSPPRVEVRDGRLQAFPPYVIDAWPLEERSGLVTLAHKVEVHARFAGRERYREKATNLLLSQMKELTDRIGARLLVATLWDGGPEWTKSYGTMSAGMRDSGIEEMDLTYRGSETRPEMLFVQPNGHPSRLVDAWWADKLEPWLREQFPKR